MAFQPLPPELRQKALQIASSYKNGGMVAKFQFGGSVDDDEPGDFMGGADEARSVDGRDERDERDGGDNRDYEDALADALRDPNVDLNEALDIVDEQFGGDDERAAQRLAEERMLAQTQQNIRDIQEGIDFDRAVAGLSGKTAAEAIEEARARAQPAKEQDVLALAALEAAERAARPPAPVEREPTVVEQALEQAASTPVDFLQERLTQQAPAQQGIEQLAPGINVQEAVDRFTSFDPAAGAGTPALGLGPVDTRAEGLARDLATFDQQQPKQDEMISLPGPTGRVASGVLNAIFNPTEDTRRAIAEGAQPIFADDGSGKIVGAYDEERGITYGIAGERFNFRDMDKNLSAAFERSRQRQEEERGRDGDDREPIVEEDVIEEEEVAAPKLPPTIDIVPFRPEDFYYFNPQRRYPYGVPSLMNMRTR